MNVASMLRKLPDSPPGNGASNSSIQHAEKILDLRFAKDYRECLKAYGMMAVNGHELTGISDEARIDVIAVTQEQRGRTEDIPSSWYVIEEAGVDDIVIWQDSNGSVFQTIPGKSAEKISESLIEYLNQ